MKLDGHATHPHHTCIPQLRGNALKELVFSQSAQENQAIPDSYVTLYFVGPDSETVRFTRTIHAASAHEGPVYSSQYRINGSTVTMEAYNKKLEGYGILVKARNFLVFQVCSSVVVGRGVAGWYCMHAPQGDIEQIAAMTPKDLTALVEKVCGSDGLRSQYDELEARKRAAEERAAFQHTRKKNLLAEKRQKKEQRDEAEKHQKLVEELVCANYYGVAAATVCG